MALDAKLITISVPASTGTQTVTGVGFQGSVAIFLTSHSNRTSPGSGVHYGISWGWATVTTPNNQSAVYGSSEDLVTASNARRGSSLSDCIRFVDQAGTARLEADFLAWTSDGFQLNWTTVTSGMVVQCLVLGGTTLTNYKASTFSKPTTPITQAITTVGFQPDLVLLGQAYATTDVATQTGLFLGLGAFTSASDKWAVSGGSRTALSTSDTGSVLRITRAVCGLSGSNPGGATDHEADVVSMDATGFTLSWSGTNAGANRIHYLALKGIAAQVGTFLQPAANGSQDPFTTTFTPKALLLASQGHTALALAAQHKLSLGLAAGADQAAVWAGDDDNAPTMVANHALDATKVMLIKSPVQSSTPTSQGEAALTSFDADGVTLTWTGVDGSQRYVAYVALGEPPPVPITASDSGLITGTDAASLTIIPSTAATIASSAAVASAGAWSARAAWATSSAFYVLTQHTSTAKLSVWKSFNGTGWSERDAADAPTNATTTAAYAGSLAATGYLYILYCNTASTIRCRRFNTATDQWETTDLGAADIDTGVNPALNLRVAVRSNGDVVAHYTTTTVLRRAIWQGSTWTASNVLGATATSCWGDAVMDSNDRCWAVYSDRLNNDFVVAALDAANSGNVNTFDAVVHTTDPVRGSQAALFADGVGNTKLGVLSRDSTGEVDFQHGIVTNSNFLGSMTAVSGVSTSLTAKTTSVGICIFGGKVQAVWAEANALMRDATAALNTYVFSTDTTVSSGLTDVDPSPQWISEATAGLGIVYQDAGSVWVEWISITGFPPSSSVSDGGTITGTDASSLTNSGTLADAGPITGTDASTGARAATLVDSGLVTAADASSRANSGTLVDAGLLTGTEGATALLRASPLTDAGLVTAAEAAALSIMDTKTAADAGLVTGTDTSSLVTVDTKTAADAGLLAGTEAPAARASAGTSVDAGLVTAADASSLANSSTLVDAGLVTGADLSTGARAASLVDAGLVTGGDTALLTSVDTKTAADAGLVTATEAPSTITSVDTKLAADTGLLTGAEASSLSSTDTKLAADAGPITGTDARQAQASSATAADAGLVGSVQAVSAASVTMTRADGGSPSIAETATLLGAVAAAAQSLIAGTETALAQDAADLLPTATLHFQIQALPALDFTLQARPGLDLLPAALLAVDFTPDATPALDHQLEASALAYALEAF